jgi:anti-sigma factor RsiW
MTGKSNDNGGWKPCPRGTLAHLAGRHRSRRFVRAAARVAAALAAAVLIGMLGAWISGWRPGSGEFDYGGIACREVRASIADYMTGRLTPDMAERIRVHLEQCPACQEFMRSMSGGTMIGQAHRKGCSCAHCRQLFVPAVAMAAERGTLLP